MFIVVCGIFVHHVLGNVVSINSRAFFNVISCSCVWFRDHVLTRGDSCELGGLVESWTIGTGYKVFNPNRKHARLSQLRSSRYQDRAQNPCSVREYSSAHADKRWER